MESQTQDAQPRAFYPDYGAENIPHDGTPGWNLNVERRIDDGRTLGRQLGWFSVGLGAAEMLAAPRLTQWLGVDRRYATLVRLYGLREVASGIGILSERTPVAGVMSRLAGDALDLATLASAVGARSSRRHRVLAAMAFVAGAAALDVVAARQLRRTVKGGPDA